MRRSNLLILLFVLLSSSCTAKEKEKTEVLKPEPKDFSYLKIQTVLPPEDQAYYKRVHNEISEIAKHFAKENKNKELAKQQFNSFQLHFDQSFNIDPLDIDPYLDNLEQKQEEYCKKAVELKQWDHLYYLTEIHSPEDMIQCLDEKNKYHYLCKCPEAMKLAVKGWNKNALYDPMFTNPHAEAEGAEYRKRIEQELRNAVLKATDRDLYKEPKVYYYEGDPGR